MGTGTLVAERGTTGVARAAFAPDSRTLAVCEADRVQLYEITGHLVRTVGCDQELGIEAMSHTPGGEIVFTAPTTAPRWAMRWALDPPNRSPIRMTQLPTTLSRNIDADTAPTGYSDAVTDTEGVFVLTYHPEFSQTQTRMNEPHRVAFAPDDKLWALTATALYVLAQPKWEKSEPLLTTSGTNGVGFQALAVSDRNVVVGRRDGTLFRVDPRGAEPVRSWKVLSSEFGALCVFPNRDIVVVGGSRGELLTVDLATGQTTTLPPTASRAAVTALAASAGFFFSGSQDGVVRAWSWDGQLLFSARGGASIRKLSLSRNRDELFILAGYDRAVRVWNLAGLRKELFALNIPPGLTDK